VGIASHADVAVAPVLMAQEFDDIVAVLGLLLTHDADETFRMTRSSGIDIGDRISPGAEIFGIHTLEGLISGGVVWPETELPRQVNSDAGHVVLLAIRSISHDTWNLLLCIGRAVDVGIELGSISHDDFDIVVADDVGF
jgi:hypothetical protein